MRASSWWHVVTTFVVLGSASVAAESAPERDVLSPIVLRAIAIPEPVLATDGRRHLAYELVVSNLGATPVTLDAVEARDPARRQAVLSSLSGKALSDALRLAGGATGATLPAGGTGVLFMDVAVAADGRVPRTLEHRVSATVQGQRVPGGAPGDRDPSPPPAPTTSFVGVSIPVGQRRAVAIAPPLRGGRWLVANGCCAAVTAHRGATLPISGTIHVAERFAIDFVQLDAEGRLTGDKAKLASYPYFGAAVYAVADGAVAATENGLPEQVPGALPAGATVQNAAGNYVVVDMGQQRFAFYAHLQPGSVRVKRGDRVRRGQVLGSLGNSGNTDAPHLHFHVMDAPSPLVANGVPFVFTSFVGEGVVADVEAVIAGQAASIDRTTVAGPQRDRLPLNEEVIAFPDR